MKNITEEQKTARSPKHRESKQWGGRLRGRRAKGQAFTTIGVMLLLLFATVLIFSMSAATVTQVKVSRKGRQQANALVLAEAGVEDAQDRILDNHAYAGTGDASVSLYEDWPNTTLSNGSYKTSVTALDSWNLKVTSVGTTTDNVSATVIAIVTISKRKLGTPESGALKANGDIKMGGTMNVYTSPVGSHMADVLSNHNISMGSNSSVDGTIYTVDGQGTASGGSGYYPNQQAPAPFSFNDAAALDAMKAEWLATAQGGGSRSKVSGNATLSGPMYINGDISLQNSEKVTLKGGANAIIFVNGNVTLAGSSTLTNGVTLIVNGTFSMGGSSTYNIDSVTKPTPALVVFNVNNQTDAISLAGGSGTDQQGVIYGIQGRIKVAGGSIVTGAIYNNDANNEIMSTGNYTQYFPTDMSSIINEPGTPSVTNIVEL